MKLGRRRETGSNRIVPAAMTGIKARQTGRTARHPAAKAAMRTIVRHCGRALVAWLTGSIGMAGAIDVLPPDGQGEPAIALETSLDKPSLYGGSADFTATLAPVGSIYRSGLRVRLIGARSWYSYPASDTPGDIVKGASSDASLLVGYGHNSPRMSLVALVGATSVLSSDAGYRQSFQGIKGVISAYAQPTNGTMLYTSLTHSSIGQASLLQAKVGGRVSGQIYVGPEITIGLRGGDPWAATTSSKRIGLHVSSMQLGPWYVSLSAGAMHARDLGSGSYLGLSLYGGF